MKLLKINTFICLAIVLISCEGNTDRIYKLDNKSAYNLRLRAKVNAQESYQIDTIIPAGLRNVMAIFAQRGGVKEADQNPGAIFSEWELTTVDGKPCKKDVNGNTWYKSVIERSSMPSNQEHLYLFEITDSDF